jgi:hypothetical protein
MNLPFTVFAVQPQTCCAPTSGPEPPSTSLSCFTSVDSPREDWRCVDPVPILTRPDDGTIGRCALQSQCPDTALCVQPRRDAKLLRLTVLMPGHWERQQFEPSRVGLEEVILWSGLRREVYEQGLLLSRPSPLSYKLSCSGSQQVYAFDGLQFHGYMGDCPDICHVRAPRLLKSSLISLTGISNSLPFLCISSTSFLCPCLTAHI